ACATWRPQFRRCKPGPRCVWWGNESVREARKNQKSTRSNTTRNEKRQAKRSIRQFFSSLLGKNVRQNAKDYAGLSSAYNGGVGILVKPSTCVPERKSLWLRLRLFERGVPASIPAG